MDKLEAGRGLDARIAVALMGYRWLQHAEECELVGPRLASSLNPKFTTQEFPADFTDNDVPESVPAFSTDIKAALTVLERMHSHFHLSCRIAYISSSQIGVAFYTAAGAQDIFTEKMNVRASDISDSLATAISRAAYKTYEALNRVAGKAEVMPNPPES